MRMAAVILLAWLSSFDCTTRSIGFPVLLTSQAQCLAGNAAAVLQTLPLFLGIQPMFRLRAGSKVF